MTQARARQGFHDHPALADLVLNFDPAAPQARFRSLVEDGPVLPEAALPRAVPWPAGAAPEAAPLAKAPPGTATCRGSPASTRWW